MDGNLCVAYMVSTLGSIGSLGALISASIRQLKVQAPPTQGAPNAAQQGLEDWGFPARRGSEDISNRILKDISNGISNK